MIAETEDDIRDLEHKLKLQEERWSQSEQDASEIEIKQLILKGLTDQIETRLKRSDASYHKLKMENRNCLKMSLNCCQIDLEVVSAFGRGQSSSSHLTEPAFCRIGIGSGSTS
ncbi:hypothetical protein K1719_035270 [Acacia pycnantha]|nr:hypothetical protein K1719_035270 [Acacia pycnantha]